jgi:hypothetical protein
MKSLAARAAIACFAFLTLLVMGWGCGILYWHLRIRSALQVVEQSKFAKAPSVPEKEPYDRAMGTLMAAGCRTLPYLVDCLDETKGRDFMEAATFLIAWESVYPGVPPAEAESPTLQRRAEEWIINEADSPERRRTKCDRIRLWWKEHGHEHHQVWRFWTNHCRPYEPEPEENP